MAMIAFVANTSADWEGNLKIRSGSTEMTGYMRMKQDLVRMDTKNPMDMSIIINLKTKKALNLLHPLRMAMESDYSKFENQAPICGASDIDGCLKKQGFKATGSETVDGHPCTVYEGSVGPKNKPGQALPVKLWRPKDLKDVPSIKMVIRDKNGQETLSEVTGVKTAAQAAGLFAMPDNYKRMDGLQKLFENMQKK